MDSSAAGELKSLPIPKKELKALLQIDEGLTDMTNKSLRYAYSKYKAAITAIKLYDQIVLEGRWPNRYQKVTVTEIRQIFVSKTVWHAQYVPCFQNIADHENMVEWLEGSGSDMDEEVWGFNKAIYQYSNLKEWLDKKQKQRQKQKQMKKKKEDKASKKKTTNKVGKERK